jgi:hypothetical protein
MSVTYGYRAARCGFSLGAHAPGGLSIGVDVLEDGTVVKRMEFQWCFPARFIDLAVTAAASVLIDSLAA